MEMGVARLVNIYAGYNKNIVLKNINMDFDGGALMVLGPNGAGKSTLINVLLGFLKPISGECFLFGRRCEDNVLNGFSDIAASSERPSIVRGSITDFLEKVSLYRNCNWSEFYDYIDRFNLRREYAKKKFKDLSAGEKMKLYISAILSIDSKLYILDEPNSNLDVDSRRVLGAILLDKIKRGVNIIMTTHIYEEYINDIATHITIINKGEVIVYGRLEELIKRYADKMCLASIRMQNIDEFIDIVKRRGIEYRQIDVNTILIYDCTKIGEISNLSNFVTNIRFASIETLYKAIMGSQT